MTFETFMKYFRHVRFRVKIYTMVTVGKVTKNSIRKNDVNTSRWSIYKRMKNFLI